MNEEAGLTGSTVWLLSVAFALAGPVMGLAPLGMAPLMIAAAVMATTVERIKSGRWVKPSIELVLIFGLLMALCALSLTWDLNARDGARKLIDLVMVLASLLALLGLSARALPDQRHRLALCWAGGVAVGLILLTIETAFDFPLYRALMGGSDPRLIDMVESKRSVDALPLVVWPASLGLARLGKPRMAIILVVVCTIACFKWTASSATLGMVFSLIVLGLSFASANLARQVLRAVTVLAFVLAVPLAILIYEEGGASTPLVKRSAQHRVEIWHFTAGKILERPLLGYGFNSSRYIPNGKAVSAFQAPDKPIIPLHPHNGFLQVWLELGLAGVAVTAVLLLRILRVVGQWPVGTSRFALAGYAAGLVVAALAFGIWQTWWVATLALAAAASDMMASGADYA